VVKNTKEWLESRKKLKERKKRAAKDGRASEEPAVSGFLKGELREQIERLLDAARAETRESR
jgi:hypothetical protein